MMFAKCYIIGQIFNSQLDILGKICQSMEIGQTIKFDN